jgi:hypothetical protein
MSIETEVEECCGTLLEVLNFLHTEFLRVWVKRRFKTEDLASALAGLRFLPSIASRRQCC